MSDHTTPERGGEREAPEQVLLRALAARVEREASHANPYTLAHGALAKSGDLRRRRTLAVLTAVSMAVIAVVVVAGGWGRLAADRWTPPPPAQEPSVAPSPLFDRRAQAQLGLPPLTAAQVEAELRRLPGTQATSRLLQAAGDVGVQLQAFSANHSARLASGRTVSLGRGTILWTETTHDGAYAALFIVDWDPTDPNANGGLDGGRVVVVDLASGELHQRPFAGGGTPFFWTSHTLVLTGPAPTQPTPPSTSSATPTSTTDPYPRVERESTVLWSFPGGRVRQGPLGRPIAAAATGDRFIVRNIGGGPSTARSDEPVFYRVHDLSTLRVMASFWEPLSRAAEHEADPMLSDDGRVWIKEDLAIPQSVQSDGPAPALPSWLRTKNVKQLMSASDGRYVFILGDGPRGEPSTRAVGVLACDPAVPAGAEMPCSRVAIEGEWVGRMRMANGEEWCPPGAGKTCRPFASGTGGP